MKQISIIGLFIIAAILLSVGSGCNVNPKPAASPDSYGKIVSELPDLPEAKARYPYPDYVELQHIPKR